MSTRTAKPVEGGKSDSQHVLSLRRHGKSHHGAARRRQGQRPSVEDLQQSAACLAGGRLEQQRHEQVMPAEADAEPGQRASIAGVQVADQALGLLAPHGALLLDQPVGDAASGAAQALAEGGLAQALQGCEAARQPGVAPAGEALPHALLDPRVEGRIHDQVKPRRQDRPSRPKPRHSRVLPADGVVGAQGQALVRSRDQLGHLASQGRQRGTARSRAEQAAVGIKVGFDDREVQALDPPDDMAVDRDLALAIDRRPRARRGRAANASAPRSGDRRSAASSAGAGRPTAGPRPRAHGPASGRRPRSQLARCDM